MWEGSLKIKEQQAVKYLKLIIPLKNFSFTPSKQVVLQSYYNVKRRMNPCFKFHTVLQAKFIS